MTITQSTALENSPNAFGHVTRPATRAMHPRVQDRTPSPARERVNVVEVCCPSERRYHPRGECPAWYDQCILIGKRGHFAVVHQSRPHSAVHLFTTDLKCHSRFVDDFLEAVSWLSVVHAEPTMGRN